MALGPRKEGHRDLWVAATSLAQSSGHAPAQRVGGLPKLSLEAKARSRVGGRGSGCPGHVVSRGGAAVRRHGAR